MKIPRKYLQELAKRSHKKHPRTRAHFVKMQQKSVETRRKNKLLTPAKK
jgi:hypothetical protein